MPAPDNLQVQTPGQPITQPTTEQQAATSTEQKPEPEYSAKFNGGPRWRIWSRTANDWFSDFVATGDGNKDAAQAEAERLNAGGEPFTKADETTAEASSQVTTVSAATTQPTTEQQAAAPRTQAVLTPEGWLVADLPVAYRKE